MILGIDASRANTFPRTGTEWYAFHVIQELKSIIPEEVTVRLYAKEPLTEDLLPLPKNWEVRELRWPPQLLWTQLRLSLEMLLRRPDILYVPAHTIPFISPEHTVTVIHDVGFFRNQSLYNTSAIADSSTRSIKKNLLNVIARVMTRGKYGVSEDDYHKFSFEQAVQKAEKIITISNFSATEIVAVAPRAAEKVVRIYNGLHTRDEKPEAVTAAWASLQAAHRLQKNEYFLTLGRIEHKKNAALLVRAFKQYRAQGGTRKLVFAGSPGYGFDAVAQYIQEQDLENDVIVTGYISDAEVLALLQHARIFLFPTRYEGFGMPILEAMKEGLPVICSDIPVLHEVGGSAAIYIDPEQESAWTQSMIDLDSREQQRKTLSDLGNKQWSQFAWNRTAEETWTVLKNLL